MVTEITGRQSSVLIPRLPASEELTASKPHKITKDHTNDKRFINFIYLAYSRSKFGIKRCKIQYFMEHFSRSVVSKTEDCLPVLKSAHLSRTKCQFILFLIEVSIKSHFCQCFLFPVVKQLINFLLFREWSSTVPSPSH